MVERGGKKYFLTVHPASTIYNRSLRSALENDLSILAREVRKKPKQKQVDSSK
jgi:uracil-DNA glycosylase